MDGLNLAIDPVARQVVAVVVEVKSSQSGSFKPAPAEGPKAFLESRAKLADSGAGPWRSYADPDGKDVAKQVVDAMKTGQPLTVIGYKIEVTIPKQGETGLPMVVIKPWGG